MAGEGRGVKSQCFNATRLTGVVVAELQTDEIGSFVGSQRRLTWIFVAMEVSSRLWPSTVTGRRSTAVH